MIFASPGKGFSNPLIKMTRDKEASSSITIQLLINLNISIGFQSTSFIRLEVEIFALASGNSVSRASHEILISKVPLAC